MSAGAYSSSPSSSPSSSAPPEVAGYFLYNLHIDLAAISANLSSCSETAALASHKLMFVIKLRDSE